MERKNVERHLVMSVLSATPYLEASQAMMTLAEKNDKYLTPKEVLFAWDRVSTCIDHHYAADTADLRKLEEVLAWAGTYRRLTTFD